MTSPEQFGFAWQDDFEAAIARFRGPSDRTTDDGLQFICSTPYRAHLPYLLSLFPGVLPHLLEAAQADIATPMPQSLAEFLLRSNGLNQLDRFGMNGIIAARPQPISLRYGNWHERIVDQPRDVVGLGSAMGYCSKADYVLHPDGHVDLITGETMSDIGASWASHQDMVLDETRWFAQFHDDDGMAQVAIDEMLRHAHQILEDAYAATQ